MPVDKLMLATTEILGRMQNRRKTEVVKEEWHKPGEGDRSGLLYSLHTALTHILSLISLTHTMKTQPTEAFLHFICDQTSSGLLLLDSRVDTRSEVS